MIKLTRAVLPPLIAACLMFAAYAIAVHASGSPFFAIDTYLVRGLHLLTGVDTKLVALIVSQIFAVLSLMLIWNNWLFVVICYLFRTAG